ncbi:lipo-like protein [Sedimenticola thiotaurini]|uniref:Lipo-like protein n=1 Tax=Sedimenticola thiotaurini TaxID=1543721 RepID=A0A0F7JWR5_9GAMM|nr:lipo-like protein [Sedimenticola thiotaurini]AKH19200.1 lipo-like protein [Sedimenticola thiotaurini]
MNFLRWIGRGLAHYLHQPSKRGVRPATCTADRLAASLRRGDVLLVEGSSRFSTAVKYLTQSTWSHAALYVSDRPTSADLTGDGGELLEVDVLAGVRLIPLSDYWQLHTRICRPVGLSPAEIDAVVAYAVARIGQQYDLKNIIDLARYLIQTPPVPSHWRRRMLALGSGDPTRAICSSLIAQAYQSVRYPILPEIGPGKSSDRASDDCYQELLHIRHHSLFTPRDFDISPYFQVIKPTLQNGFDPHALTWGDSLEEGIRDAD